MVWNFQFDSPKWHYILAYLNFQIVTYLYDPIKHYVLKLAWVILFVNLKVILLYL